MASSEILESGKYVTDLFAKRGIALSFFRISLLPPEAALMATG
jgi:hypothetical protein